MHFHAAICLKGDSALFAVQQLKTNDEETAALWLSAQLTLMQPKQEHYQDYDASYLNMKDLLEARRFACASQEDGSALWEGEVGAIRLSLRAFRGFADYCVYPGGERCDGQHD